MGSNARYTGDSLAEAKDLIARGELDKAWLACRTAIRDFYDADDIYSCDRDAMQDAAWEAQALLATLPEPAWYQSWKIKKAREDEEWEREQRAREICW